MKGNIYALEVQRWHMQPANVRESKFPAHTEFFSGERRGRLQSSLRQYSGIEPTAYDSLIRHCRMRPSYTIRSEQAGWHTDPASYQQLLRSTRQHAIESASSFPSDFDTAPATPKLCDVYARS